MTNYGFMPKRPRNISRAASSRQKSSAPRGMARLSISTHTWEGKPFNRKKVAFIRGAYKLSSRRDRTRRRGMLTTGEVAEKLGVAETTVHQWGVQGLIKKCYSDRLRRGLWDIPSGLKIIRVCARRRPRPARLDRITAR